MPPNQLASLFQLLLGGGQQRQAPSGPIDFSKVDPNTPIAGYMPEGQQFPGMGQSQQQNGGGVAVEEDPYSPVAFLRALRNDPVGDRNKQWTMTGPGGGFDMAKEAGFFKAPHPWEAGGTPATPESAMPLALLGQGQVGQRTGPAPAFQPQPYQQVGTWMPGAPGFEELYSQGKPIARRPARGNGMGSLLYR